MATEINNTASSKPVLVKLVLLGESAVGKSSVVLRFCQNEFQENKEPTIGAAFLTQRCRLNDKVIKFEIWDTAGQERFRSLSPMYYRNAQAAVVVYDVTQKASFEQAKTWVKELHRQASRNIVIALVGNKVDLCGSDSAADSTEPAAATEEGASVSEPAEDEEDSPEDSAESATEATVDETTTTPDATNKRQISFAEGSDYASENSLIFFESSAKTGYNVVEVFTEIAKNLPLEQLVASAASKQQQAQAQNVNINNANGQASDKACAC